MSKSTKRTTMCACAACRSGKCGVCQPKTSSYFPAIEHGLIKSERDFLKLDIVDWNRRNGYWSNSSDALQSISSWFVGHTHYTVIEADLNKAPARDDFPGWKHVGAHVRYGKLFWNWFHYNHEGELHFSDSPDFYGEMYGQSFWGDVGQVSASAFAFTQKQMQSNDLWISLVDEHRQIVIEPTMSIFDVSQSLLDKAFNTDKSPVVTVASVIEQLRLF